MQKLEQIQFFKSHQALFGCVIAVLLMSSCANRKPIDVDEAVRDPAADNQSLIQVSPMIPEAVKMLLAESAQQISKSQPQAAILTLKRALGMVPGSAIVQQHLAEVHLSVANYKEAMYFSSLVVNQGPDQGELCERSRRTQALAAEMLGDIETQAAALESIEGCSTTQSERY